MDERERDATRIFRELKNRPTPELDSEQAWRRLRTRMPARAPRRANLFLPAGRLSWALAATAVLAVALVAMWPAALDEATSPVDGSSDLVLLADAAPVDARSVVTATPGPEGEPATASSALALAGLELEIRLVQGYDGTPPPGARPEGLAGAGGASEVADVRATLRAILPFPELAMLGSWRGEVTPGAGSAALSETYGLEFELVQAAVAAAGDGAAPSATRDQPLLRGVRLVGGGQPLVAEELALEPGRLYLFGVREQGSEPGSLVLAIRLHQPVPPNDASSAPPPQR